MKCYETNCFFNKKEQCTANSNGLHSLYQQLVVINRCEDRQIREELGKVLNDEVYSFLISKDIDWPKDADLETSMAYVATNFPIEFKRGITDTQFTEDINHIFS